jgi:hypothetical protein
MPKIARFSRKGASLQTLPPLALPGAQTGQIVNLDENGVLFVDFPANPSGPVAARLAVGDMVLSEMLHDPQAREVLLVFEDNDLTRPIIVGPVRDRLPTNGIDIHVHGRRFTVETDQEVELRCGDAKLRISRDGKIVVLGNDVVSRARRQHKIKGGTVNIN